MHSVPRSYMPVTEGRRIPFKTPLLVVGGRRDGEFCDHSLAQYVRWWWSMRIYNKDSVLSQEYLFVAWTQFGDCWRTSVVNAGAQLHHVPHSTSMRTRYQHACHTVKHAIWWPHYTYSSRWVMSPVWTSLVTHMLNERNAILYTCLRKSRWAFAHVCSVCLRSHIHLNTHNYIYEHTYANSSSLSRIRAQHIFVGKSLLCM